MRVATRTEIEYLSSIDGHGMDAKMIREMSRRLDALRRYDQCFDEADWRPPRSPNGQRSNGRAERNKTRGRRDGVSHSPGHFEGDQR
jgi:hypothetical protein